MHSALLLSQPMSTPHAPAFFALLSQLAGLSPDWAVFNQGYEQVLQDVHRGGTFDFNGLRLTAPPGVYPPRVGGSTWLMASHWEAAGIHAANGTLLELGTGAGGLALMAARLGWRVTASDLDMVAVEAARQNAEANGVLVPVVHSDLFSAFADERFNVIVFNLPLYHKETAEWSEHTLSDAKGALAHQFLTEAKSHLLPDGYVLFTYSNCSDPALLERTDWDFELVGCDYAAIGRYWRAVIKAKPR